MNALTTARAELAAEVGQKEAEVAKLRSKLVKLDDLINDDGPAPTAGRKKPGPKPKADETPVATPDGAEKPARKKPGPKPKPKAEGAEAEVPKVKGKPGPKPKVKAEASAPKTPGTSRAAEGRRAVARGDRPPLKVAMALVMGTDTCNPEMVYDRMSAKGWLPASSNPKTYLGYTLSSSKDTFDRVPAKGRGFYKVKASAMVATDPVEVIEAPKVEVVAAPKAEKKTNGAAKPSTDDVLKEAGFDLTGPFGG